MDDDAADRPRGDPDRVLEEMDEAAEVDKDLGDGDRGDGDKREAVERAWDEADGLEGEAPSG